MANKRENIKKVAIMTWYSYNNYGSVLQAFALSNTIENLGYNAELIKFNPEERFRINYSTTNRIKKNMNRIKNFINNKILYPKKDSFSDSFDEFRNQYLKFTNHCITSSDLYNLNNSYDCFVCGSDQIWAPNVFDSKYFLDFVNKEHKVAYAPSIGLPKIENQNIRSKMAKLISDFKYLSTREENGKRIIREICGKNAEVVLDPTLLLDKSDWVKKLNLTSKKEKYILCYFLTENSKTYKSAKRISKELGIPLKIIPINNKDFYRKNKIEENVGPLEFINLIQNATLVLTDSFHGTIFSINFNIPFVTFKRFKDNNVSQNSRIYNILKVVNLEERIYNDQFDLKKLLDIDFENANKKINIERKKSLVFLKKSLDSATNKENYKENITNFCTGCGVCAIACPKKCITIEKNEYGFYEKKINTQECINCNLCKKVCCQNYNSSKNIDESKVYSAVSNDRTIIMNSSSGGIAHEIALYALNSNISVIGCTYDFEKDIAKHIVVNNVEDLNRLNGSKYLQSYTIDAFEQIKKINNGLIIGTPCQIASIDIYLKTIKKRDQFILVDLICHGVPSYNLWNKYLKEKRIGKINNISFRNKKFGWRVKCLFINSKSEYYGKESKDEFLRFFTIGNSYNRSCYECNYRSTSCADIRLGDFWGPKFKKNKTGVSMVITFSDKGEKVINEIKKSGRITINNEKIDEYKLNQQIKNFPEPLYYDDLINDISSKKISLYEIDKKYIEPQVKRENMNKKIYKVISFLKKRG